jgi:hypothetical protein
MKENERLEEEQLVLVGPHALRCYVSIASGLIEYNLARCLG